MNRTELSKKFLDSLLVANQTYMSATMCQVMVGYPALWMSREGIIEEFKPQVAGRYEGPQYRLTKAGEILAGDGYEIACRECQGRGTYRDHNGSARNSVKTCPVCNGRGWQAIKGS